MPKGVHEVGMFNIPVTSQYTDTSTYDLHAFCCRPLLATIAFHGLTTVHLNLESFFTLPHLRTLGCTRPNYACPLLAPVSLFASSFQNKRRKNITAATAGARLPIPSLLFCKVSVYLTPHGQRFQMLLNNRCLHPFSTLALATRGSLIRSRKRVSVSVTSSFVPYEALICLSRLSVYFL